MTDEISTADDGVTVRKSFDADSFPVPAITFDIESTRSDAVELSLVDEIPETFPMDHVGFHPDYESDRWTAYQDHRVQYERTLEAGETVTTVYGIRIDDPDESAAFLETPTVDVRALGEPADPDAGGVEAATTDVVPPESTDVVREAIAENRTTVPGLGDDEADEDDSGGPSLPKYDPIGADAGTDADVADDEARVPDPAAGGRLDAPAEPGSPDADADSGVDDAAESGPATDETADDADEPEVDADHGDDAEEDDEAMPAIDGDGADGAEGDEEATVDDEEATVDDGAGVEAGDDLPVREDGLVESLAAEIRSGDASADDLAVVGEALAGTPPSTETRIDHLQSRLSDLEAYADALEAFIDENGSAQQVLEELGDDVAVVSSRADGLAADLESAGRERDALRDELGGLADAVDDLQDDVGGLVDGLADAESRLAEVAEETEDLADLRDDVAGLRDDLADVDDDVDALQNWREQLTSVLGGDDGDG